MGLKYTPSLDGLRAFAALVVLYLHSGAPGLPGGARGVDVFFVLSGYLITSKLRDEAVMTGRINAIQFWARRARRLVPALALVVAAYLAVSPDLYPAHAANRWRDAATAMLYVTDYSVLFTGIGSPIGHTWSLAIEEQFYLLWPLVLPLFLVRRSPGLALLGLWVVMTGIRAVTFLTTGDGWWAYFPLHAHASGLVLGAALAFSPRLPNLAVPAFGVLLWSMLTAGGIREAILLHISIAEIASALMIAGLVQPSRLSFVFAWEPIRWLGLISYGVYLWHFPISRLANVLLPWPQSLALTAVLSISLAALSYFTVERAFRASVRLASVAV